MDMDLAIPVRKIPLRLVWADGQIVKGNLFLRPLAEARLGPETAYDRLNDAEQFLAVEIAGEGTPALVNKARLLWVEAESAYEAEVDPETGEGTPEQAMEVEVQVAGGQRIAGTVMVAGPPGLSRLSDFLNSLAATFFVIRGERTIALLNRHQILRISQKPSR